MNTVQCTGQDSIDLVDTAETSDALTQRTCNIFRWMPDWLALQAKARMPCLPRGEVQPGRPDNVVSGMASSGCKAGGPQL